MARPSKLTQEQWAEVARRHAAGEGVRALAAEFGISPARISERVSKHSEQVREVAHKVAAAQTALAALPIARQHDALNLADKLRNISVSLSSAAELGAATAHRLNALANSEVAKVDDADPLSSVDKLKGVQVLTKLSNDAAYVALNLLAANKEAVQKINAPESAEETGFSLQVVTK